MLEKKITKAAKVQGEIAKLEWEQKFLPDTEVQKLEEKLASILKILGPDKKQQDKVKAKSNCLFPGLAMGLRL